MKLPKTTESCSLYFKYQDFINCSDTFKISNINNIPLQKDTYIAISNFSKIILDNVQKEFGQITITYGFCGLDLQKLIKKIYIPKLINILGMKLIDKGI